MNQDYKTFERMIHSLAWKYSKRSNVEQEEFVSIGNLVFVESSRKFKPGLNCAFSTYLWNSLVWAFKNYLKKERKQEVIKKIKCEEEYCINHLFELFDRKSVEVIRLVQNPPEKMMRKKTKTEIKKPITKKSISLFLAEERNWTFRETEKAFNEIRKGLKEVM